ncbi:hypothetical protein JCM10450v2_003756 [Rhodotorula kratochvilovae]
MDDPDPADTPAERLPAQAHEADEELDDVPALPSSVSAARPLQVVDEVEQDENATAVDEVLVPYTFGRTPSLRLDELNTSTSSPTLPPPSDPRPALAHRPSSVSSRRSVSSTASSTVLQPPPRPYALPPGLAAHSPIPPPSLSSGTSSMTIPAAQPTFTSSPGRFAAPFRPHALAAEARPRAARIAYEPPLPLDVQILLLTTPPPPKRKGTVLARAEAAAFRQELLAAERARKAKAERKEEKRLGVKALRLLGGLAGRKSEPPTEEVDLTLKAIETLDLNHPRTKEPRRSSGRIDSKTPGEYVPKTWKDYEAAYAAGQLDIEDPPFPPLASSSGISTTFPSTEHNRNSESNRVSPYEVAHFPAPLHLSTVTPVRERLIAQLDLLGETYILPAPMASAVPLHVATAVSPVPSLGSAGSSATSGRRDSLMQFTNSSLAGRRSSNASTAPSTTNSVAAPMQKSLSGSAVFPSHPFAAQGPSPALMVNQYGHASAVNVDAISAMTLKNHPALMNLLRRALYAPLGSHAMFKPAPKAAMITLFPSAGGQSVTILASLNLPTRTPSLPVSHALDAHVLLAGERGLVIPDTERDWRFRGNEVVCMSPSNPMGAPYGASGLGIRFFAGMPIFAPSLPAFAGFEEEAGGRIAIGTVSLLDDWPRTTKFGATDRANLRSLASEITHEIDRFLHEREQHRFARRGSISSAMSSSAAHSSGHSSVGQATMRSSHAKKVSFDAGASNDHGSEGGYVDWDEQMSRRSSVPDVERERAPTPAPTAPLPEPPAVTLPPILASTPAASIFNAACSSLAQNLDLSLVYLVSLDLTTCPPAPSIEGRPALNLMAAYNLPTDSNASFDPALHLRALRAPEGGLLYRSPSSAAAEAKGGFASGILLPIAETETTGWVLAGYTSDRRRRWGEREMDQFDTIREGLAKVVLWKDSVGEGA